MRLLLVAAIILLLSVPVVRCQSVRPAIAEYPSATEGRFDVVNDSLLPMFLTLEAKSFIIDDEGVAKFSALAPTLHVQLSQTSMRLPPHSQRTVYYKASAETYPSWFCIYTNFTGAPRRGSVNVELELPHTVYMLGRSPIKEDAIHLQNLHVHGSELEGLVRNTSGNMVRLHSLLLTDRNGKKHEAGGFPLLPGGVRQLHLPVAANETPDKLRVKFGRSSVESQVP